MERSEVEAQLRSGETGGGIDIVSLERKIRCIEVTDDKTQEWLSRSRNRLEALKKRQRTKKVNERADMQNESLRESRRVLQETEDISAGILSELSSQRETIKSSSAKLQQANDDLGYGDKLLRSMQNWWSSNSIQK